MLNVVVSFLLAAPLQAKEDLVELCQKLSEAESYTFEVSTQGEGRGPETTEFKGHYVKGQAVHFERGDMQAYRMDGHLVARTGDKGWKKLGPGGEHPPKEGRDMKREKPGKDDEGGDDGQWSAGQETGQENGDDQERPGRERGDRPASNPLETLPLPHDIARGFGDHVGEVKKEEKNGKVVFTGDLNEAGIESLLGGRRPPSREGSEATSTGQFKITAMEGNIQTLVVEVHVAIKRGDQEVDRSRRLEYTLSDVNNTQHEVPAEVLELLK